MTSAASTGLASIHDTTTEWNRLQFAIRSVLNGVQTATLVKVMAVGNGTVDVQPMVAQTDGAGNAVPHGTIHALPIWQLQGGLSAVIVVPTVGDIGLAVFAHSDISAVKKSKAPNVPGSARKFDYADGVYLGGVLNAAPTTFVQIDDTDGVTITSTARVTINAPSSVDINSPVVRFSDDVVITGDIMTGAGSKFNGKEFDSHVHSGVTAGGANSGPPV